MAHRIRPLALSLAAIALVAVALVAATYFWFGGRERARPASDGAAAASATLPGPVAAALAAIKTGQGALAAHWRYRESIRSDHFRVALQYDPDRPAGARWQVLEVNGKAPDRAEARRLALRADHGIAPTSDWLARSRYRLMTRSAHTLVYQISPRAAARDSSAKLLPHLSGRLVLERGDHLPVQLSLENFESFSPRFGVTIKQFRFAARFRKLGARGPVVVERSSLVAHGRMLWVKGFEQRTTVTLSDFVPAAAKVSPAATR